MTSEFLYRLEYANGEGMYCTSYGESCAPYHCFEHEDDTHPDPHDDISLCRGVVRNNKTLSDYFYAFRNREQMLAWVGTKDALLRLHDYGIMLAIYTCDEDSVVHGERQSVFCSHSHKDQYNLADYVQIVLDSIK